MNFNQWYTSLGTAFVRGGFEMGYMVQVSCSVCQKDIHVMIDSGVPQPTVCRACADMQAAEARAAFLAECVSLPINERLARIEALLYDLRHQQQLPTRF